jgi:hypothetical protein
VAFQDGDRDARVPRDGIFAPCVSASSPQLDALQRARGPAYAATLADASPSGGSPGRRSLHGSRGRPVTPDARRSASDARAATPLTPLAGALPASLASPATAVTAAPGPSLSAFFNASLSRSFRGSLHGSAGDSAGGSNGASAGASLTSELGQPQSSEPSRSDGAAAESSSDEDSHKLSDSGVSEASLESSGEPRAGTRYY